MNDKISISPGNRKMGNIPSISLPILTCDPRLACYHNGCYAKRMEKFRPVIYKAWARNLSIYMNNPRNYERQIEDYLYKKKPSYFRWHVGGDIPDIHYYYAMLNIAFDFKDIHFVTYTKKYSYINKFYYPSDKNLNIRISMWPNENIECEKESMLSILQARQTEGITVAWLLDDKRWVIHGKDIKMCKGSCESCKMCWTYQGDILLKRH